MTSRFRVLDASTDEISEIAKVLGNKTAQKILAYVEENAATESEIVNNLKISASTVHYNIKQLKKCKLLIEDAMHYSPKGKEVIHYKATNEHIIISPRNSFDLAERLQTFIPIILLIVLAFSLVEFLPFGQFSESYANVAMSDDSMEQIQAAPLMAEAKMMTAPIYEDNRSISQTGFILIGMLFGVLLTFIISISIYLYKKR